MQLKDLLLPRPKFELIIDEINDEMNRRIKIYDEISRHIKTESFRPYFNMPEQGVREKL